MNPNYKLIEKRDLPEVPGVGYLYSHTSGARIMHIATDDVDKVFNAVFRTPCHDDTGLPHILEHCVLNGSEKYPLKDPFGALMKGSLVTFLNAMTYPDLTMYPVASYNDKDFFNLMGVYLDAVFKPMVHKRDLSFLQEGWHYDLADKDAELSVNGVVYSEMKGSSSSPDSVMFDKIRAAMFPESHYRFNSGGDPEAIPTLTYEDFKGFHKTLYHPANAYIFLYGDMDIEKSFALLDEYLCGAEDRTEELAKLMNLPLQTPFEKPNYLEVEYSISETDTPEGKNYLSAAFGFNDYPDPVTMKAVDLLMHILLNNPAAPLRNALMEKQVAESVGGYAVPFFSQPGLIIYGENSKYNAETLRQNIIEILNDIVAKGLDKDYVTACLNVQEFHFRERGGWGPRGLNYSIYGTMRWAYNLNPFDYFNDLEAIAAIRTKIEAGDRYFEELIERIFLNNNFAAYVTLKAVPGLQAKKDAELKEMFAARKAEFSPSEIDAIVAKKAELTERQNAPDSDEVKATVPIVSLADIKKEYTRPEMEDRGDTLYAPIATDGLVYNFISFDMSSLTKEELSLTSVLRTLLGSLDTKKRKYTELFSEINTHLGGLSHSHNHYTRPTDANGTSVWLVNAKSLDNKQGYIYSLAAEVLTETLFEDRERIKMLLTESKVGMEQGFIHSGNWYATMRVESYLENKFAYNDFMHGYGYYEYLKELVSNFDERFDELKHGLESLSKKLFSRNNMRVAMACADGTFTAAKPLIADFRGAMSDAAANTAPVNLMPASKNEGFIAESQVNYCLIAFNHLKHIAFSGSVGVLCNVIDNGYLLPEIREKGGAYGYGVDVRRVGYTTLMSYRDPNLERTYEVYKKLPQFIASFKPGDREMLQYQLGSINDFDRPAKPKALFDGAFHNYMTGVSLDERRKERAEILTTDAAKIRSYADAVDICLKNSVVCTFGSDAKISEGKALFDKTIKL
ncbi:MAG: insulinase family protein [Defluviitaleaceae bacterium]|nr:insulinase family protein [Defluviitaleaceae bacterium]